MKIIKFLIRLLTFWLPVLLGTVIGFVHGLGAAWNWVFSGTTEFILFTKPTPPDER